MTSLLASFALQVVSDAVLILERKSKNVYEVALANPAFEQLCGIDTKELKFGDNMFLLDEQRFLKYVDEAIENQTILDPRPAFQLKKVSMQCRLDNILVHLFR
jgi:hypothetical protein